MSIQKKEKKINTAIEDRYEYVLRMLEEDLETLKDLSKTEVKPDDGSTFLEGQITGLNWAVKNLRLNQ